MATKQRIPSPGGGVSGSLNTFDDIAEWIANPPEDRPFAGGVGRAGQNYCNFIGNLPGAASGLLGPGLGLGAAVCKPYWDKEGYDPPQEVPPFTGGRCPILYTIELQNRQVNGDFGTQVPVQLVGPIASITVARTAQFTDTYTMTATDGRTSSRSINFITFAGSPFTRYIGPFPPAGIPDNCGNPPGPLGPGDNPPPTPTPFPPGQNPGTDPDGQPFFFVPPLDPVIPGTDPVPVPEHEPGGDGGSGGGPSEPPTGTDGGEGDAPGGEEPFGDPPAGERWVGCCVTLIEEPVAVGVVPSSGTEKIYTTVYGNLRLTFDSLNGSGYDTPIQIRSRTACVWEPVRGLEPTGVRINLNPGFRYQLTKYSVPVEN